MVVLIYKVNTIYNIFAILYKLFLFYTFAIEKQIQ